MKTPAQPAAHSVTESEGRRLISFSTTKWEFATNDKMSERSRQNVGMMKGWGRRAAWCEILKMTVLKLNISSSATIAVNWRFQIAPEP